MKSFSKFFFYNTKTNLLKLDNIYNVKVLHRQKDMLGCSFTTGYFHEHTK